jgi:hypothetical protein
LLNVFLPLLSSLLCCLCNVGDSVSDVGGVPAIAVVLSEAGWLQLPRASLLLLPSAVAANIDVVGEIFCVACIACHYCWRSGVC